MHCFYNCKNNPLYGINDGTFYTNNLTSLQRTSDGGYVLAGFQTGDEFYERPVLIIKVDSLGARQWRTQFEFEYASGVIIRQTADGGYIVGATTVDREFETHVYTVYKLDSVGKMQWHRIYGVDGTSCSLSDILQAEATGIF